MNGLGRVPNSLGGHGKEEIYWLRQKLDAAITHLRDIEDYYRFQGGTPTSYNTIRADRARDLYESITDDFVNGKTTRPTRAELERALRRAKILGDNDFLPDTGSDFDHWLRLLLDPDDLKEWFFDDPNILRILEEESAPDGRT